ncbi:GNAT family N-acetyltransferase [Leifsonia sp. NPDC077715]|uniref:GNAT family N-acetyltransferase n=1 Tax=Leifsonia sp. NPDC077715 TaxID=3155539 RepID=UPI003417B7A3
MDRADQYWAEVFHVERAELRRPGVHFTYVDEPRAGIYVLQLDETVRVRAPMRRRADVDGIRIETALDGAVWRAALADSDPVVLGPAAHYLAGEDIPSSREARVPSIDEVRRMTERIPPEEVEESGVLDPDVDRFGLWAAGTLAALSSLSPWVGGRTDVGLLVAPGFRGRGLGRRVAAMALNAATRRSGIARWRCREENAASVAIALGFGLQPYARNLGIRL